MSLRVMVVDDEPIVRSGMKRFLSAQPDLELTPAARDGAEAVRLIERHDPHLVFLDVQMPELNGFDVLAALERPPPPAVVFVTAYDRYALQAFEVHAVDYLLKPFDEERLGVALDRARYRLQHASTGSDANLAALLERLETERRAERFMIRSGGRIFFVQVDEVDWFEAADNYVRLHVGDRQHLIRDTIANLERRLDPDRFIRVHRSAIVNLTRIAEMIPLPSGDCDLVLTGGATTRLSRSHREGFERRMVGG